MPDLLRRDGHVDVANSQRVDDGVHHRRQRACAARLAASLDAEAIGLARDRAVIGGGDVALETIYFDYNIEPLRSFGRGVSRFFARTERQRAGLAYERMAYIYARSTRHGFSGTCQARRLWRGPSL